jgi:hypothetical protein
MHPLLKGGIRSFNFIPEICVDRQAKDRCHSMIDAKIEILGAKK